MKRDVKAVIDIGSNSIKLRILCREGRELRTLTDTTDVVRLGSGGVIAEDAMRHGVDVVGRWVSMARDKGAERPRLVGTMALRSAANAEDFVRLVRERTGLKVEILSGEEEARLAWLGALHGAERAGGVTAVFDTGGGSTEFILGSGGKITRSKSFSVGAMRLTEEFFASDPVSPGSVERALAYIRAEFSAGGFFDGIAAIGPAATGPAGAAQPSVIGLGGGVVAMASVKLGLPVFIPGSLNAALITLADVDAQVELYAGLPLAGRMKIAGLPPKRADIVLASACIVRCALEALAADALRVSINGLRHGLLLEMYSRGIAPAPGSPAGV